MKVVKTVVTGDVVACVLTAFYYFLYRVKRIKERTLIIRLWGVVTDTVMGLTLWYNMHDWERRCTVDAKEESVLVLLVCMIDT